MVFARVTLTYLSCLLQLHRPLPNTIFLRAKKEKYKKPIGIQCEDTQTLMRNKNTRHGLYCTEFEPVIFTYSISKSKSKHLSLPIEIFQHKNKRFSKLHEKVHNVRHCIELMPTMRYSSFGKSTCHHGY